LNGTLPSAQIGGTYSGAVNFNNNANTFSGAFSGAFSGNGANLTSLNASQLASGTVADARLSGNVALLNANQTFTGENTFTGTNNLTGVNTFTNFGNSFRGSFFGNGLVGWIPTNGTSVQAVIDTGYLLTSRFYTTVTLPLTAALTTGDIVRISGAGLGGWRAKLNSGQSFFGNLASYSNSFQVSQQVTPLSGNYRGVAASANGIRMYAVGIGIVGVSASSDSGRTWSSAGLSGDYQAIACSANARIVYAVSTTGAIQKSTDSGATWNGVAGSASTIACTADGGQFFITTGVACSGNGTNQAKVSGGVITLSTNGGANFTVTVTAPAANLSCVAASSDCTRLVAGVNGGLLYGSANAGATWTTITTTNQAFFGAWMSGDGTRFATAVNTSGSVNGLIYNFAVNVLPIGVTNSIVGSQGSAVEIQYTGNGQFMPVSSSGTIWAN
jgi:hypothetical protein